MLGTYGIRIEFGSVWADIFVTSVFVSENMQRGPEHIA
jgi:hypothetical protein